jgi:GH15 family glucan-1,4-alpha-glucosidase
MDLIKAKKILVKSVIQKKKLKGAIKTELQKDRYPFIYSRDASRIAMALDSLGFYKEARKFYNFIRKEQSSSGEWVQRYSLKTGLPIVSRPRETDCVALVLCGMVFHYKATNDKNFIKSMWPSINKALNYLKSRTGSNNLVSGRHAIHENYEVEEGFEIWTNSWTCKAYKELSEVARQIKKDKISKILEKRYDELLDAILTKMWNKNHFIKCIKPNGNKVDSVDVTMISPAWSGILPSHNKKIKKTISYLASLWDRKIGGYRRFKKMEAIKDWHWYDGGHGSWLIYTSVMERLHRENKQYAKAKKCRDWISRVYDTFQELPEHLALLGEYKEWKKEEWKRKVNVTPWLTYGAKKAEKYSKIWVWNKNRNKVVPWVKTLIWPWAELVLNQ